MAYIRTIHVPDRKTGKVYEYKQLVEAEWNGGHPRQRVLAHLGRHDTPDAAIAELKKRRAPLAAKLSEHRRERLRYEKGIRDHFSDALEKHHGGEIPSLAEAERRAGGYGYIIHHERRSPEDAEKEAYMADFGDWQEYPEETHSYIGRVGPRTIYRGYHRFDEWLRSLEYHGEKARGLAERERKLSERIRKLEACKDASN